VSYLFLPFLTGPGWCSVKMMLKGKSSMVTCIGGPRGGRKKKLKTSEGKAEKILTKKKNLPFFSKRGSGRPKERLLREPGRDGENIREGLGGVEKRFQAFDNLTIE